MKTTNVDSKGNFIKCCSPYLSPACGSPAIYIVSSMPGNAFYDSWPVCEKHFYGAENYLSVMEITLKDIKTLVNKSKSRKKENAQ